MKPLLLEMTAFGPFVDYQRLDFTALGEWPLFLINGPTGAGKTTILDGICFALYGKTTGNEREASQMRCDGAPDELLTEVSFEFALAGNRYRIRRIPEQYRAKKSGDGMTLQKSEAFLEKLDGERTVPLAMGKVTEVTAMIEDLLGLEVEQFRQVMVLPQGQFRKLLLADSKEREAIFGQLFQTGIYKRIEDSLKQRSLELKAKGRELDARRAGILETAGVESIAALDNALESLRPELELATKEKQHAEDALALAIRTREQAETKLKEFAALDETKLRLSAEEARSSEMAAASARLDEALKAEGLTPLFVALGERSSEQQSAQVSLTNADAALALASNKAMQAIESAKALPLLESQRRKLTTEIERLHELKPQMLRLSALQQTQAAVASGLKAMDVAQTGARTRLAQAANEAKELSAKRREQSVLAASLQELEEGVARAELSLERQRHYWQKHGVRAEIAAALSELERAGQNAKGVHAARLRERELCELAWHQGQAALLAARLMPGEACPVCGSAEHPRLAHADSALPSEAQLAELRGAEQQSLEALSRARADYKAQKQRLELIDNELAGEGSRIGAVLGQDMEQQAAALASLKARCQQARDAHKQLASLDEALADCANSQQTQQAALDELQRSRELKSAELARIEGELQSLQAAMPDSLKGLASAQALDERIAGTQAQLSAAADEIATLNHNLQLTQTEEAASRARQGSAKEALQRCETRLAAESETFNTALRQKGFSDTERFLQAKLDEPALAALQAGIARWQQACVELKARLASQQESLGDLPRPELEGVKGAEAEARALSQTAVAGWQIHNDSHVMLSRAQTQLAAEAAALAALDAEYATVGTLSDAASGMTGERISLQRFVLGVLLDDVLIEASHRLLMMSKGRYRLIRKEDKAKGNRASGLDLDVEDAYTGKVRPVATLSGGESFMAALALALGLSDVVQAYAGGIKLDTLFIDEGFGSLDQDALELAIRTLIELQSAGRMIGVISHVSEMKEQIGLRVNVQREMTGSRISLTLP